MCDGTWTRLESGQSATVPQGSVHTFRNPLDRDCTWLTAFSPRGFERLFVAFGVPVEETGALERSVSEEMVSDVISRCATFGMIVDPSAAG
jgi:hypothetical protein